jgi:hypothetical protein
VGSISFRQVVARELSRPVWTEKLLKIRAEEICHGKGKI